MKKTADLVVFCRKIKENFFLKGSIKHRVLIFIINALLVFSFPLEAYSAQKQPENENEIMSYINIGWWKQFNDDILTDYIIKTVRYNHDLKQTSLKVKESIENKNLQRAAEFPLIGIGAIPALYKLPSKTTSERLISLPLYASYELDLFGKNRDKTKSADKMIEISKENERAAYLSAVSATGSTYYNIVKLDKTMELQEKLINDRQRIYYLMKLSNEEGLVSASDAVSAEKAYIKSLADMIELKKTREKLLNTMCVLTGENPENSEDIKRISFDDLVINKQIPDFIVSDIIENRPDYIIAEKTIEKIGIDVRAARKEFLPSFNIFGLISFNSTEYISKMNWTNSLAVLGGGALLPLFTGGKRIAYLKLNKNKYEQAVENYKKTNLTAIKEINDALCDLKLDNDKYLKTLEIHNAEKEDFRYTELKFEEGIISGLDLLQKRETLITTEKLAVSDKTDYFINQIGLYKAAGGAKI